MTKNLIVIASLLASTALSMPAMAQEDVCTTQAAANASAIAAARVEGADATAILQAAVDAAPNNKACLSALLGSNDTALANILASLSETPKVVVEEEEVLNDVNPAGGPFGGGLGSGASFGGGGGFGGIGGIGGFGGIGGIPGLTATPVRSGENPAQLNDNVNTQPVSPRSL